jgi:hypothetical protein
VPRIPVRGGPYDGRTAAKSTVIRWLGSSMGYARPGPGRALYVLEGDAYVFAGSRTFCLECGSIVNGNECPLGHGTISAHGPGRGVKDG